MIQGTGKVYASQDWGFVGHEGTPVRVNAGDEYDAGHPLVKAHPELFTGRNPLAAEEDPPRKSGGRRG